MRIMDLLQKKQNNKRIPSRDVTGKCAGECRDRIGEGERERQNTINHSGIVDLESYPNAEGAHSRNEPPGMWGGHV